MKKTLVLASLLAAFGAASAQSTVTLGGVTAFGYQKAMSKSELTQQPNKGLFETDFLITLKGVEQLGGGLSAGFSVSLDNSGQQVATQVSNALIVAPAVVTGSQNFRATVQRKDTALTLNGGFGTVTLTNTRSSETAAMAFVGATNLNDGFYDGKVFARSPIDLLGYSTASMGGLVLGASLSEAGTDGGYTPAARATTLSARYAAGPLALAAALKHTSNNVTATIYRSNNFELGATYDLGVAKVGFGYDSKPASSPANGFAAPAIDKAAFAFGVSVPFGTSSVGFNMAKRDFAKITEFGYQNNLSARTNVNFSVGSMQTTATASRGQYRVSLNHAF
jgi:predicted porin